MRLRTCCTWIVVRIPGSDAGEQCPATTPEASASTEGGGG
jgi:hypothetical protein